MYAQLDFTNNPIKRVNLIGGDEVGIIPALIEQYPNDFINLEGRDNIPLDTSGWYYDTINDQFITTAELPPPEPEPQEPYQPSNAEIAQQLSDLQANLEISGVLI